jgi:hypothetical protein
MEVSMKILVYFILVSSLCMSLVVGCSTLGSSAEFYGVQTADKNIVFVIDVSGSMEGKNEGNLTDKLRAEAAEKAGQTAGSAIGGKLGGLVSKGVTRESTKLASVKRELGPAIRGLGETTEFTIVLFSDSTEYWKTDLVTATSGNKSEASLYVERLESSGGTGALKGLQAAFGVKGVDTIFFLSDGFPSDASSDKILEETRNMNQNGRVKVYSIGVGDDKDEAFLKALAEQNGGRYAEG